MGGLVLGRHPAADTGRPSAPRARAAVADGRPGRRRRRPLADPGRAARSGHGLLGEFGPGHARYRRPAAGRPARGRRPGRRHRRCGRRPRWPPLGGRGGPAGQGDHGGVRPHRLPALSAGRLGCRRGRHVPRAAVRGAGPSGAAGGQVSAAGPHRPQRRPGSRRGVVRYARRRLDRGDRVLRPVRRLDRAARPGRGAAGLARRPPDDARFPARAGECRGPAGQRRSALLDRRGDPAGTARTDRARPDRPRTDCRTLRVCGRWRSSRSGRSWWGRSGRRGPTC